VWEGTSMGYVLLQHDEIGHMTPVCCAEVLRGNRADLQLPAPLHQHRRGAASGLDVKRMAAKLGDPRAAGGLLKSPTARREVRRDMLPPWRPAVHHAHAAAALAAAYTVRAP
jgi:hypothetical protein